MSRNALRKILQFLLPAYAAMLLASACSGGSGSSSASGSSLNQSPGPATGMLYFAQPPSAGYVRAYFVDPTGTAVDQCASVTVGLTDVMIHTVAAANNGNDDRDEEGSTTWMSVKTATTATKIDLLKLPSVNTADTDDRLLSGLLSDIKFTAGQTYNGLRIVVDTSATNSFVQTTPSSKDGKNSFPLTVPSDKIRFAHFTWTPQNDANGNPQKYAMILDFDPVKSLSVNVAGTGADQSDLSTDVCSVGKIDSSVNAISYQLRPVIRVDNICLLAADGTCTPLTKTTTPHGDKDKTDGEEHDVDNFHEQGH